MFFSMNITSMCETWVLVALEMETAQDGDGLPGLMTLCYSAPAIAALLDRLAAFAS
jgi:hypothetical protein